MGHAGCERVTPHSRCCELASEGKDSPDHVSDREDGRGDAVQLQQPDGLLTEEVQAGKTNTSLELGLLGILYIRRHCCPALFFHKEPQVPSVVEDDAEVEVQPLSGVEGGAAIPIDEDEAPLPADSCWRHDGVVRLIAKSSVDLAGALDDRQGTAEVPTCIGADGHQGANVWQRRPDQPE